MKYISLALTLAEAALAQSDQPSAPAHDRGAGKEIANSAGDIGKGTGKIGKGIGKAFKKLF